MQCFNVNKQNVACGVVNKTNINFAPKRNRKHITV